MDKKLALANMDGRHIANYLFFQARNLAIEAMLLRLENQLLREGFPAKCEWVESSFGGPSLYIRMRNPSPKEGSWEFGQCTAYIKRDTIQAPINLSSCFYSLDHLVTSEYWRGREPKLLVDFRQAVENLAHTGHLAAEIEKLNYPFDYQQFSSF